MNILGKLFSNKKPFWEESFSSSDLAYFYESVSKYFEKHNIQFSVKEGFVIIHNDEKKLDLRNLAQNCHSFEKEQWNVIIEKHFDTCLEVSNHYFEDKDLSFELIREKLAVRIWPAGTLEKVGPKNLIYRKDIEETISALVIDSPDSIRAVTPRMASSWEKSNDVLFNIGLVNVEKNCKPDFIELTLANEIKVIAITKDKDIFTSTHALFIKNYPTCLGIHGSLVGLPAGDLVICYPINEALSNLVLNELSVLLEKHFRAGPSSVSPLLYWYYEGNYSAIKLVEKQKKLIIPVGLAQYMSK